MVFREDTKNVQDIKDTKDTKVPTLRGACKFRWRETRDWTQD